MPDTSSLREEIQALNEQLIADRRHFHQHPELGFQERETAAYVAERLRSLGIDTQTGIAQTGVVGLISGRYPGPTVLLRADMDALPLTEETGAPYASQRPGVHHACGHDGHTAILLAVSQILARRREEFAGNVKLVFQPAEEGPGGAEPMIAAGVMEQPHVDACFGLHLANDLPVGTMLVRGGPVQASADDFEITVEGVGGHGASPHQTVDAVAVGAGIVNDLHRIVSREVDPLDSAVVTVGAFHAGTRHNIIAPRATLVGTIRALDPATRERLHRRISEIAQGVAAASRATAHVTINSGYPVTVNDPAMAAFARGVAETVVAPEQVIEGRPIMGSEDMSYFLNAAPGCFVFVGSRNEARNLRHPHHSPLFDFDEAALPIGVELLTKLALAYLERTPTE
ncbi:MAG TPA: amidohydrolase [Ktedonobacterales bacterium]|nr:amidohydrolase [Ktedonobacterales bacterium]